MTACSAVLLKQGRPTLWHWHWQCLQHDCAAALGLPLPAESVLLAELATALPLAVGKIVLTRGSGAVAMPCRSPWCRPGWYPLPVLHRSPARTA